MIWRHSCPDSYLNFVRIWIIKFAEKFWNRKLFTGIWYPTEQKKTSSWETNSLSVHPWYLGHNGFYLQTIYQKCPFKRIGRLWKLLRWFCRVMKRPPWSVSHQTNFHWVQGLSQQISAGLVLYPGLNPITNSRNLSKHWSRFRSPSVYTVCPCQIYTSKVLIYRFVLNLMS